MKPLKLVVGFLPGVDRLPRDLSKIGFIRRVAFVLETYRADSPDLFFDAALYEALVNLVRKVVEADTIQVIISARETAEVLTAEAFHNLLMAIPDAEREPLPRCFFLNGSATVAVMGSEPWAHVGGPDPYHDSYTLAVFTKADLSDVLVEETRAFLKATGGEISSVSTGQSIPTKLGLLSRLKNIF